MPADSIGVFQVESRAQMTMLPRLRPRKFYDLVIEVAIVRPGPDPGRHGASLSAPARSGEEPVESIPRRARQLDAQVLGKTLGVPLFQEQAMRSPSSAAGFTPRGQRLRRAMATFRNVGTIGSFRDKMSRAWSRAATTAISPSAASSRSRASALRLSRKAMPPASRCWSMSRPGSSAIIPTAFACALLNSAADGLLRAGADRARRARARRRGARRSMSISAMGLHARGKTARLPLPLVRGGPGVRGYGRMAGNRMACEEKK